MSYDPQNVFGKVLRGELPCHKVYEDHDVLAFMDIFPQVVGHTLVIPKTESEDLFDLDPEWTAKLAVKTQKVAKAVRAAFNPDGVRIMQLNGTAAGQTIFHIHFHILPMIKGIGVKEHAAGERADDAELAKLAKMIADKL